MLSAGGKIEGVAPVGAGVGVTVGVGVPGVTVGVGVAVGVGGTGVATGVGVPGVAVGVGVPGVAVGVGVPGVTVGVGVPGVAVGVGGAAKQPRLVMLLVSIVTAPFRARALPSTLAPVCREMLVRARIFPTNSVVVPRVAELPTCQNTLQAVPPLITLTDELLAVVSVLPIWRMKTAASLP